MIADYMFNKLTADHTNIYLLSDVFTQAELDAMTDAYARASNKLLATAVAPTGFGFKAVRSTTGAYGIQYLPSFTADVTFTRIASGKIAACMLCAVTNNVITRSMLLDVSELTISRQYVSIDDSTDDRIKVNY